MYLGAHYLSDVVSAAVLGIFCAFLVTHFFLERPRLTVEHEYDYEYEHE
jgi:membrane-associated phospholipid phosphatase